MSGHSKWSKIKRKKGANDQKKGVLFTKLGKNISVAAKNGKDPEMNPGLRTAIDQARAASMPKENIEKAVLKGAGELPGVVYEEVLFECYAAGGIAMIIECVTDNTNRTVAEVRSTLTRAGSTLGSSGSVLYMFEQKGVVRVAKDDMGAKTMDDLEMISIDNGAEDIQSEDEGITLVTGRGNLNSLVSALEEAGIGISFAGLEYVTNNKIEVTESDAQKVEELIEQLEELDDVNSVFTNLK
ncbi:MAG: YebC/PmpR family DNA-binding transcriptional regulator [Candidatus Kerfeldbacteria bacterium CG15_BIG_FIL_POST_REV_8_21_14_020_45_12]|uniref:Probable transcriptional regulatory protein COW24_04065 n=1 Tax=Candidatus Kerfeldbacteria bacterium CG15_BIG_FIL_POST_REV_8_21_14_020_45_12 TaxID=2014247 RepID=A0A2M7H3A5_9BACT|nr:MAG: YebC/PmpR family DNA-binding transcriptional regulator [Candidatus Kerfeldbacteria bacterium CG15_BIG_FIL_POST_REV_8_21_14_020_45_12]PJA93862.1 MAG: YebC/PmpR family DNA-binding transcriptional regulator [Candidatus Kerfeldbacteria bacterium CG_4_9_14_3_um_filter_45_8]